MLDAGEIEVDEPWLNGTGEGSRGRKTQKHSTEAERCWGQNGTNALWPGSLSRDTDRSSAFLLAAARFWITKARWSYDVLDIILPTL